MPSNLVAIAVCALLLQSIAFLSQSFSPACAEPIENETQPKLTTTNQPGGTAEGSNVADTSSAADEAKRSSQPGSHRIFTARLYGSLCTSCLKHLNDVLKKKEGVLEAIVSRPVKKEAQDGQPPVFEKWATVKVEYEPSKISKEDITKRLKQSDFIVRRAEDVEDGASLGTSP
jgi:hypothetical protein